jgi:DNA modification methylase
MSLTIWQFESFDNKGVRRMEENQIYQKDCLLMLADMADESVDCFTDPPYNVNKDYGEGINDNLPKEKYVTWITKVLTELRRVSVNLTVFTPHKWARLYWNILGDDFQEIIVSFRPSGAIRRGFSNQFVKLLTNASPPKPIRNVWDNIPLPACGWFFRENTYNHPGYTSLAMTKRVVSQFCNSPNPVFDPFCGTGTTLIAAIEYDKDYIGCDLSLDSVILSRKRVEKAKKQIHFCFGTEVSR